MMRVGTLVGYQSLPMERRAMLVSARVTGYPSIIR
jgi:hypothetical protein